MSVSRAAGAVSSAKATRKPKTDDDRGLDERARRFLERIGTLKVSAKPQQSAGARWAQLRAALSTISKLPDGKEIRANVPRSSRRWLTGELPSVVAWPADFETCWDRKLKFYEAVRESKSPEGALQRARAHGGRTE